MVRQRLQAALLCAGTLFVGLACAQATGSVSLQQKRVEGLSGDVVQVVPCGPWRDGDQVGERRLVLMRVHGGAGTEVYLQWLSAPDPATWQVRPVRTIGIGELNNDHAQHLFSQATCSGGRAHASVVLRGVVEHDERARTRVFDVTVQDTGKYVVRRR